MPSKYDYGNLNDHDLRELAIEELRDIYEEPTDNVDHVRRHMATIRGRPFVVRWACTHVPAGGWRGLMDKSQGQFMLRTQADAQRRLDTFMNRTLNPQKTMEQVFSKHVYASAQVRPVECYKGHYDPKCCGFGIETAYMNGRQLKEYAEVKEKLPDYGLPSPLQALFLWAGGDGHGLDSDEPLILKYQDRPMSVRQMHPLSDTERWGRWNPEVELLELAGPDGNFSVYMKDWHWLDSWAGDIK